MISYTDPRRALRERMDALEVITITSPPRPITWPAEVMLEVAHWQFWKIAAPGRTQENRK